MLQWNETLNTIIGRKKKLLHSKNYHLNGWRNKFLYPSNCKHLIQVTVITLNDAQWVQKKGKKEGFFHGWRKWSKMKTWFTFLRFASYFCLFSRLRFNSSFSLRLWANNFHYLHSTFWFSFSFPSFFFDYFKSLVKWKCKCNKKILNLLNSFLPTRIILLHSTPMTISTNFHGLNIHNIRL